MLLLDHYIASSHNTCLGGRQVFDTASAQCFFDFLKEFNGGCVEVDLGSVVSVSRATLESCANSQLNALEDKDTRFQLPSDNYMSMLPNGSTFHDVEVTHPYGMITPTYLSLVLYVVNKLVWAEKMTVILSIDNKQKFSTADTKIIWGLLDKFLDVRTCVETNHCKLVDSFYSKSHKTVEDLRGKAIIRWDDRSDLGIGDPAWNMKIGDLPNVVTLNTGIKFGRIDVLYSSGRWYFLDKAISSDGLLTFFKSIQHKSIHLKIYYNAGDYQPVVEALVKVGFSHPNAAKAKKAHISLNKLTASVKPLRSGSWADLYFNHNKTDAHLTTLWIQSVKSWMNFYKASSKLLASGRSLSSMTDEAKIKFKNIRVLYNRYLVAFARTVQTVSPNESSVNDIVAKKGMPRVTPFASSSEMANEINEVANLDAKLYAIPRNYIQLSEVAAAANRPAEILTIFASMMSPIEFEHETKRHKQRHILSKNVVVSFPAPSKILPEKADQRWIENSSDVIFRTYPPASIWNFWQSQVMSANYNPYFQWLNGIQMVAFNFQTKDIYWQLHKALFKDGAFRPKPPCIRNPFLRLASHIIVLRGENTFLDGTKSAVGLTGVLEYRPPGSRPRAHKARPIHLDTQRNEVYSVVTQENATQMVFIKTDRKLDHKLVCFNPHDNTHVELTQNEFTCIGTLCMCLPLVAIYVSDDPTLAVGLELKEPGDHCPHTAGIPLPECESRIDVPWPNGAITLTYKRAFRRSPRVFSSTTERGSVKQVSIPRTTGFQVISGIHSAE